jgi:hypothetical protein
MWSGTEMVSSTIINDATIFYFVIIYFFALALNPSVKPPFPPQKLRCSDVAALARATSPQCKETLSICSIGLIQLQPT